MIPTIMPIYNRANLKFQSGKGVELFTDNGTRYLDFAAGIAVNALGHCHPKQVKALQEQAAKLWHVSNLYEIGGMQELAGKLTKNSFADTVFFCNSGTEAVECGIKMVRKYHKETGHPERYRIITFEGAFHGRTLAAASASGPNKCIVGFEPAVEGFDHVPLDLERVKQAITKETGSILIEPIQGEGGIIPLSREFMQTLRQLCDEHGLLLFLDEVQSGIGRTGKFYAHEHVGITPDIVASAKGIGGGFPLGACLATEKAAKPMTAGSHGSTYGGNPLAMAVGNAVLDVILSEGFLANVTKMGNYLQQGLGELVKRYPNVLTLVRGTGLMIGLKVVPNNREFMQKLRDHKLLTAAAGDNVIRFLPPLIVEQAQVDEAMGVVEAVCKEYA